MPTTCNYYVTLRCNQRCVFCNIPHTNDGSPSREPKMEQIAANLRDLKRLGVAIVDVTGGEPLLFRHLVPMLAMAKKLRLLTTVTTNGMLYPRFARDLLGKVDALLFSIDSTDPAEHDRIRAVKSFHLALEALATARSLRQPLYISHVVTNESFAHLDEMVRFAKDQQAILYLNPCFSFFGNEGLDPQKANQLQAYFGQPGIIVDRAQLRLIASGGNDPDDPVCRAVTSTVVISPENQLLLPCYHFKHETIPIENNLYELYNAHPRVLDAKRMEGRYDFCKGCTVYCYMRSSLFRRYPMDSVLLGAHYLRERARQKIRIALSPTLVPALPESEPEPEPMPAPVAMAVSDENFPRRRLPLVESGTATNA
jgi:MoaA/NifB/PqqE/SkfB family radical SAM enzyme